ncbi:hypothetical protein [Kitasatospora sp. MAP5-34]|uniref:membrane protein YczE n=1 Tax=Kitasatospora sp. MAP5-34 TaxID=3035102 RepID=UPI002475A6E5|nr:hypothetical protein [Kitasatospora sp. MAP5-34]MDH6579348.1 putative membrane protein YczE [Kitasatospora sp. MAP5-34]
MAATTMTAPTPWSLDRLGRRLPQLLLGLWLYGASSALMVRAGLGVNPWTVFHQGMQRHLGLSMGAWTTITGAAVLLLWIPLRQRPGLGTIGNVLILGVAMDLTLGVVTAPGSWAGRIALLLLGVVLNGLATGLYIGARLGPGPRDGLMTGLHLRTGRSLRLMRVGVELTVLAVGILLGGMVGVGTVVYALAIGPLAQFFLRLCMVPEQARKG